MSVGMQEVIALSLVALAAGALGLRAVRATCGDAIALWILMRVRAPGAAKFAMWLRAASPGSSCGQCSCPPAKGA